MKRATALIVVVGTLTLGRAGAKVWDLITAIPPK